MIRPITRRSLLKGMLGGAVITVGLPPLELFMNAHGTAYAADGADGFPKRFGIFFWGNGILPERWVPDSTGTGDQWALSDQLKPLEDFKAKIALLTGMRVMVPNIEPHHATMAGILTGRPVSLAPDGGETFSGPTIDQIIAKEIGQETLYKSIEFGTQPGTLSYNGPHSGNPPEKSPMALFERIFGGSFALPGDDPVVDPSLGLRRSVLDAVMGDIEDVRKLTGAADTARLDQHLDGIRDLEKRLAKLQEDPPNFAACAYPPTPEDEYPEIEGRPQLQEINEAFSQIIALALACDQTRVFSNEFTRPLVNCLFEGATAGHHKLTHDEPGEQPGIHDITLQCMAAFRTQLAALDAIEEGDGSLLDHCLVFGTSDVSSGKLHSGDEFPIVLAGGANGALKTDIHLRSEAGDNASKALLSITRAMGMNLPSIGSEEGYVEGGVSGLEP